MGTAEWQPWAIYALSIVSAGLGWLARELWAAVKSLRTDLESLRVHLAQNYPTYDRLAEVMKPITTQLDRIEGALRSKADRP